MDGSEFPDKILITSKSSIAGMRQPANIVYSFGDFCLDPAERLLLRNGDSLSLSPKVFDALVLLVENAGHLVEKDEFMRRLWPETFVGDDTLSQNISLLRKALANGTGGPEWIVTVPRRGYRFIAPVALVGDFSALSSVAIPAMPGETKSSASVLLPTHQSARLRILWAIAIAAASLVGLAATFAAFSLSSKPRVLRSVVLTETASVDAWGRLNTDGARIFFLKRRGDHWNLMEQSVVLGEAQPFPHPFQNARVMSVSPDGSELLIGDFSTRTSVRLWLMPAVGGEPRPVGNVVAQDAAFTPDGQHITYSTEAGIFVAGLAGEDPKRIFSGVRGKFSLSWRPDAGALRFTWEDPVHHNRALWEIGERGEDPHLVLPQDSSDPDECCGRWSPDGRYYFFVSVRGGTGNLWALQEKP